MDKADFLAQYDGLTKLLHKRLERLEAARRAQIKTKLAFERDQDALGRTIRDLKMALAQDPAMDQPDPRTGKSNETWRNWLIERAIEKDPDFIKATGDFYATQETFYTAEMEMHQAGEELSATKAETILFAALMKYVSSPE